MNFKVGQRVRHKVGDLGTVDEITDEYVIVRWDGYPDARAFLKRKYLDKHPAFLRAL